MCTHAERKGFSIPDSWLHLGITVLALLPVAVVQFPDKGKVTEKVLIWITLSSYTQLFAEEAGTQSR